MVFSVVLADFKIVSCIVVPLTIYFDIELIFSSFLVFNLPVNGTAGIFSENKPFIKVDMFQILKRVAKGCSLVCFNSNIYQNTGAASIVEAMQLFFPIARILLFLNLL